AHSARGGGHRRHPRRRVRRGLLRAGGPARRRYRDRRRPDRGDPLRGLVLRDRGGAGPRPARRDHPGGPPGSSPAGRATFMSWEALSFLILGAGLLAGFAWYERSRPPSQVVALVAALAALAIAGRIAFAAFPNVKPTTDIVIFAGYALGPAPGFAVGALT